MVHYTMPCSIYIRQQTVKLWVRGCFYEVAVTLTFIQGHNICMQRILRHTGNNYASFVTLTWDFEKKLALSLIFDPNP